MTLCIYHGNCADGFGAAWAVRKALGDAVEFHAGIYQDPPPDVAGRDVLMVDFAYKRPVIEEMAQKASSITVLDHHKTSQEDLEALLRVGVIKGIFDLDRSGAGIAWDYFHPNKPRPQLINHIEDRDLWRFDLPGTREIQACVFSHPYDFDVWDRLMGANLETLRQEGEAIERKHHKDVAELVSVCRRRMVIGGQTVWAASLPYTLTSDAGHMMAEDGNFGACYWDTPQGRVFSLRSRDDGPDVSEVAKQYGGGGHRHAAGFRVPFERLAEFEVAP